MDRNKFNLKIYEQHLSDFGKKVLHALTKQWNEAQSQIDKNNNYRRQCERDLSFNSYQNSYPYPRKRVLNYNTEKETPRNAMMMIEKPFNFNIAENISQDIPKSVEIFQTLESIPIEDRDKVICDAPKRNLIHDFYNKDVENLNDTASQYRKTNKSPPMDVNWDNMFDTELFADAATKMVNEIDNNEIQNDYVTSIANHDDLLLNKEPIVNEYDKQKDLKRKNETNSRNNKKPKKQLKDDTSSAKQMFEISKNTFRKQNYTKTVKNWLDNTEHTAFHEAINMKDIIDDSIKDDNQNITSDKSKNVLIQENEKKKLTNKNIVIDKNAKSTKKVVQSRLANKDGIMKFSKPKKVKSVSNKNIDKLCIETNEDKIEKDYQIIAKENSILENKYNPTIDGSEKEEHETKNKKQNISKNKPESENNENPTETEKPKINKEKKAKKFVAPIKSQIPIKDISYKVITIEENSINKYSEHINAIVNSEITAVLIFSNGFSQLNKQYTDDDCVSESVLVSHDDTLYCFKGNGDNTKVVLKSLIERNKIICYDGRSILIYLSNHLQIGINSIDMYDTKIGASLLDPDHPPENFAEVQKTLSYTAPYTIATECVLQKTAWYMTLLNDCWTKLHEMLVKNSLWKVFVDIEMSLLPIIADMERRGVLIDMVKLKSMEEILLARMKRLEQECHKAAGRVFQINSTMQVRAIVYDELRLDEKCNVKIRETLCKGAKSTSETMLRSLTSVHPLPRLILEYRHIHKAYATFLNGIAQHVKHGVVKPVWEQTAAATGRIASNNPNLQAIPKAPFDLVMFPETDAIASPPLNFRSVYISEVGHSLLAADFKHIECRVFAHAAADTGLMNALASDDLFRVLAAKWLHKPEAEVTSAERERTKRLVYASLYGAGARKLMEILDVNYEQALEVTASFNRTFPSLKSFGRGVVQRCTQHGNRLGTLCGRVRQFPNISRADFAARSHAERQAVNFVVQGSAADLCKMAMISTEQQLRAARPAVDAHLLLQIHDELVWHVRDQHLETAAAIIKRAMEECGRQCGMSVSLPVSVTVGKSWGQMEPHHVI